MMQFEKPKLFVSEVFVNANTKQESHANMVKNRIRQGFYKITNDSNIDSKFDFQGLSSMTKDGWYRFWDDIKSYKDKDQKSPMNVEVSSYFLPTNTKGGLITIPQLIDSIMATPTFKNFSTQVQNKIIATKNNPKLFNDEIRKLVRQCIMADNSHTKPPLLDLEEMRTVLKKIESITLLPNGQPDPRVNMTVAATNKPNSICCELLAEGNIICVGASDKSKKAQHSLIDDRRDTIGKDNYQGIHDGTSAATPFEFGMRVAMGMVLPTTVVGENNQTYYKYTLKKDEKLGRENENKILQGLAEIFDLDKKLGITKAIEELRAINNLDSLSLKSRQSKTDILIPRIIGNSG